MVKLIHVITSKTEVEYGYLTWKNSEAGVYEEFFPEGSFKIDFLGEEIDNRNVDSKNRRLSIPANATKGLEIGDRLKLSKRNNKVVVEKAILCYTFSR